MLINPLVSIGIPTYNSEKTIENCIESINKQSYKNIEIIIIDNLSSDNTTEIASRHNAKIVKIKASRSKARNIGINQSNGSFILCIDSDMELTEHVVKNCVDSFQKNKKVGGIIIPERSIGDNFWVKVRDFERSFYAKTEIESARFFKKDIAESVGGYEEDIVFYEESTLPQKIADLGLNINLRIDSYILHNERNFNLGKWLKKKYFYAKTLRSYAQKYKGYASRQYSLRYRYLIFLKNKNFYSKPLLAAGVLILKTLEFLFAGFGYLMARGSRT